MTKPKAVTAGAKPALEFHPLTPARWTDLEKLFGAKGACGGCWCMSWRLSSSEFTAKKGEGNRKAFEAIVDEGRPAGILAYVGAEPVGWCAVAPRGDYPKLARSRVLKPLDDKAVWSVTCLFIARPYRNRGVSSAMLRAAVHYVGEEGGELVEGYPVIARKGRMPDAFAWTGILQSFERAGFKKAGEHSAARPIMRCRTSAGRR